jgi:two-component system phosphate regulon response regulator PhoB
VPSILFVEDEVNLQTSLGFILETEGYSVTATDLGERAVALAREQLPDIVLLDINLPDIDGFEVCRRLRANPATAKLPILLLSARTSVEDVVEGLEQYADDYLTKPFHPRVLLARIHALLRRASGQPPRATARRLRFEELEIDFDAHQVLVAGEKAELTKSEFDVLRQLATHPQRVLTRDEIIDAVRGQGVAVTERTVDFQVSGLRRKLGSAARLIETVRGVGYKLVG